MRGKKLCSETSPRKFHDPLEHFKAEEPRKRSPRLRSECNKIIKCFWKSSIPDKWLELTDQNRVIQLKNNNGEVRNTLNFLEESQKYIHGICPRRADNGIQVFPSQKTENFNSTGDLLGIPQQSRRKMLRNHRTVRNNLVTTERSQRKISANTGEMLSLNSFKAKFHL